MIPKKTWKDWLTMIAVAVVLVGVFLAPAYIIHEQREETTRIAQLIQEESQRRLEQAIHVNTFTITCLLAIPPEERTEQVFRDCIERGFEQAPNISESENPED